MSRADVRRAMGMSLGLLALAWVVFGQVQRFDFVGFDDPDYVSHNTHVAAGLTRAGVAWAFTTTAAANWHPLTWLSLMADAQIFGVRPGPFHLTNLALHAANTLLLFWLLARVTGALGRSAFVAALFAVHPLHVESVAWIAERKDVLSALCLLLTLHAWVAWTRRPAWTRYTLALGLFTLGLLSKPMLVTLPLVLGLLDVWPLHRVSTLRGAVARVTEKLPFLALAAASSAITVVAQHRGGALGTMTALPLTFRLARAVMSYVAYLGLTAWPARLAVFYPYPPALPPALVLAGAALALLGITTLVLRAAATRPYLAVGWLWFLVTLLPVIGLLQVGDQAMADRYTYLPLIGVFVMLAWGAVDLAGRTPAMRRLVPIAACAAVLACAMTAHQQTAFWQGSLSLWTRDADAVPPNYRAQAGLADALVAAGRTQEAIDHYTRALQLAPAEASVHNSLGLALTQAGRVTDAAVEYATAVRLVPDYADAHNNLGAMLARQGHLPEAIAEYSAALQLAPDDAMAHDNLCLAFASSGRLDDGIEECGEALRLEPAHAEWHYQVAAMLEHRGRTSEAITHLERAVEIDPNFELARTALAGLRRPLK